MSDDLDLQLKREFLIEAGEMLEAVESAFIEFERNSEDSRVIDKIFRLAHTIKGSALSCGFAELGEFAHVVETLLVRIREKKLVTTPAIVDVLLKANDRLVTYVRALEGDMSATVATADIVQTIQGLLATQASAGQAAPKKAESASWGIFEDEPVATSPGWGIFEDGPTAHSTSHAASTPPVDAVMRAARTLVAELAADGLDVYTELLLQDPSSTGAAPAIQSLERLLERLVTLRITLGRERTA